MSGHHETAPDAQPPRVPDAGGAAVTAPDGRLAAHSPDGRAATTELLMPGSGVLVELDDPEACAWALDELAELEAELEQVRQALSQSLIALAQEQGTKTLHLENGLTARVSGGERDEYDLPRLAELLRGFGLPDERLAELIVPKYRLSLSVARQLRGANPDYAAALESCRTTVPQRWRVNVERKGHR